jgi:hypothetical protein
MASKIKLRRDTAARWAEVNPILADGEPGYETDTKKWKVGDGVSHWNDLAYQAHGDGTPGPANTLTIGTVATGAPGSAAAVSIEGEAPNQVLNFTIPRGTDGSPGTLGQDGADGADGVDGHTPIIGFGTGSNSDRITVDGTPIGPHLTGPQGLPGADGADGAPGALGPATNLTIGNVTTGAPGGVAAASIRGTAPNLILDLTLPRGDTGSAATLSRGTVSFTSGTLANTAVETGTVALGMRFDLLRASASAACRLRLYQTAAHRTADAGRAIGVTPVGDHGVIADIYFVPGALDLRLPPLPPGANLEDTPTADIPYSLQNLSGGSAAITINLLRLRLE